MDPFLERPDVFSGLHDGLITYLREALQPILPSPYYADMGRRAWIEVSERYIGPDVNLLHRQNRGAGLKGGDGGVATASRTATRPLVIHVPHDERREPFVEIYAGRGRDRRLVTSIEILSPSNKKPGEEGRDLYLRKQRELLNCKVHLVEIDLLRGGEHTTAVPHDRLVAKAGPWDYHVCVHPFDDWEDYIVYAIQLAEPLPVVSVPLLPGDGAVAVDLQAVFTRSYDTGPYAREIDYLRDRPVPPLAPKQARWARQCLAKLRGTKKR
jgi:hypothetical protein